MDNTSDILKRLNNPEDEAVCRAMLQSKFTYRLAGYYLIQGMMINDGLRNAIEAKKKYTMKYIVCYRCGKVTDRWHYVNGKPVCADDRSYYPQNKKKKGRGEDAKTSKGM